MKRKTVIVIFFKDTQAIWGIFTTEKKAIKALNWWGGFHLEDFYYMTYNIDYRGIKGTRGRYVSDVNVPHIKALAELDSVPIVDRAMAVRSQPMVRDDELPDNTKAN